MCGRYVIKTPIKTIAKMHRVFDAPLFEARYNVAPTQSVPIVRAKDHGKEMALVRWGFIPSWAKDAKIGYRLINARADTVATKPSFRSAFKRRRCVAEVNREQTQRGMNSPPRAHSRADVQDAGQR